ncbi:MAG: trigger factor [Oscillatoriales cyanobacterium SM2_2_1]|nr:trigger factor [Oscillatoriales cyanobacterium SM2_2_1]
MKVTLEKRPDSKVCFAIEVEGTASQELYDKLLSDLMRRVQIPGFRPGKAPKHMVIRDLGAEKLKANVLEQLFERCLPEALKQQADLKPVGQFELVQNTEELLKTFEIGQVFRFDALIDVEPELTIPAYRGITVQAEKVEPDPDAAAKLLHTYQKRKATLVPVEGRPAALDDVVIINQTTTDSDAGTPIDALCGTDIQADLNESGLFPEVVNILVGAEIGQTVSTAFTLNEKINDPNLIGKSVNVDVTLLDLKHRELPPLDDAFAQSISDKQTLAELQEFLVTRDRDQAAAQTRENAQAAVINHIIATMDGGIPETLIRNEVEHIVNEKATRIRETFNLNEKDLRRLFQDEEVIAQIVDSSRPEAIARIQRTLLLREVVSKESLDPTPEEIAQRTQSLLNDLDDPQNVDPKKLQEFVTNQLATERALEWLLTHNTIEYVSSPPPGADPQPEATPNLEAVSPTPEQDRANDSPQSLNNADEL